MSSSGGTLRLLLAVLAASVSFGASAVGAQQARAVGVTPPRLSFVDGEVSYWRPGAEDWVPAQINTALAAGDSLYAGDGGNVEVEIESRAYVRAGSGTELGIESLETGYLQLRVPSGHAAVDLKRLSDGQEIEVDTPNGAFLISHTGYYRFDVDDQATRFSARRGGLARVVPAGGEDVEVGSSQQVVVSGTDNATVERVAPAGDDAWDRWNAARTAELGEQPRSAQYVPPDVAGIDDLDRYGDWRDTPKYGHVWVPRDLPDDWAPYSTGRWVWDGYYGWTWVDDSPWGWAPYHYGRWCWNDGYWGWAPGPIAVRPVYAPALVAFFGDSHFGVSVSVGTPFVSWVALGWGEPVVPWWGPRGFVGRPYWGGWGGPRVVNNTVINNTTIVNVNTINRYDNFRNRHAVIGVEGDRFGRGRGEHVRVDPDRVAREFRPVRGELGVRPSRESLTPRAGRGERPPDRIQSRQVVATRPPQDPARQPRAAGLVPSDARRQPAPRIVAPRTDRATGRDFGGSRNMPPAPGGERGTVHAPGEQPDVRGRDVRGSNVGERGAGEGRGSSGVDRIPGGGRGETTRGAPNPPNVNERVPSERGRERTETIDRGGTRDRNRANEGRDAVHAPAPPSTDRIRQQQRERETGNDAIRVPSESDQGRGRDRNESRGSVRVPSSPPGYERHRSQGGSRNEIQIPRDSSSSDRGGSDVRERGRSRVEQPERSQRIETPREQTPPRTYDGGSSGRERGHSRIEQQPERTQQMPAVEAPRRNERQERPPSTDSGRSIERQSAPRVEHHEAPHREAPRQEAPQNRGGAGAQQDRGQSDSGGQRKDRGHRNPD